jgi:hypothetical protein
MIGDFSVNLYFIKGVMFGFEMCNLDEDGKYIVFDLFIVRIYIEY